MCFFEGDLQGVGFFGVMHIKKKKNFYIYSQHLFQESCLALSIYVSHKDYCIGKISYYRNAIYLSVDSKI